MVSVAASASSSLRAAASLPAVPAGFVLRAPRLVSGSPFASSLLEVLEVSLPDEDAATFVVSVESRPGGRFLLLASDSDPFRVVGVALLRRRLRSTFLVALAVDPAFRSQGLGSVLVLTAARLAPAGLGIDVAAPPKQSSAVLLEDPSLRLPDPDERRLAFYLRLGAQPVSDIDPDDGTLELWLPPRR